VARRRQATSRPRLPRAAQPRRRCGPTLTLLRIAQEAGNLSIVFDLGGVVGGALAGALADASGAAACVSAGFVAASVPALVAYRALGAHSLAANLALMAAAGLAVNGPYALITTAVSADLGSHRSLAGAPPAQTRPAR
jgi:sugar phosphate permease